MKYNWQQPDWPEFRFTLHNIEDKLSVFVEEAAHVSGILKGMAEDTQREAIIDMMVAEAVKTSEIEGEYLSRQDVMSSIRNNLGFYKEHDQIKDKKAEGIGELMVAVRNTYLQPLTIDTLFEWHKMLLKQNRKINVGVWRSDEASMQVVSGALGKETIHFEAPLSNVVPHEMKKFIQWFNDTAPGGNKEIKKAPVRSAIAHLYFESIHPFEDGNGRIGRAIAEKALSQTVGRPILLSLSQSIDADKKAYYTALENAQQSNEITNWISYFVNTTIAAQQQALVLIDFILKKAKFFDRFRDQLNERQFKIVTKMMEAGPQGFEGGMNANKYLSITKVSKATATRDLQELVKIGVLTIKGNARNTSYTLNI